MLMAFYLLVVCSSFLVRFLKLPKVFQFKEVYLCFSGDLLEKINLWRFYLFDCVHNSLQSSFTTIVPI